MRVLYFAQAAEAAGCREEVWEIAGPLSLDAFWEEAVARHPGLAPQRDICRVASGMDYVGPGDVLDPGREVAVIPPVSGG
jgi:molybdopterin synthase catalytic subunit/molybdopterin synthase sulfur carrier subunit